MPNINTDHSAPATGATRWGIVADGVFKVLLGTAYVVACVPVSAALHVSITLTVVTGIAVVMVGGAEIRFLNMRTSRSYLLSLMLYDGAWVLITIVALIIFFSTGSLVGWAWLGYQVIAAVALTIVLLSLLQDAFLQEPRTRKVVVLNLVTSSHVFSATQQPNRYRLQLLCTEFSWHNVLAHHRFHRLSIGR